MTKRISEGRKTLYYIGGGLVAIGFILFISVFFSAAVHFGDFANFEARGRSMAFRSIFGMVLMIGGGVVAGIGAKGLAGSGVLLDPEEAKEDLEPYARMTGGLIKDALDEADISLGGGGKQPEKVIMVKCQACGKLNNEDAKFCQECGKRM